MSNYLEERRLIEFASNLQLFLEERAEAVVLSSHLPVPERCEGNLFDNGLILTLWDVESRNYQDQGNKDYTVCETKMLMHVELDGILHFTCSYGPKTPCFGMVDMVWNWLGFCFTL